jgi:hypothetical protein
LETKQYKKALLHCGKGGIGIALAEAEGKKRMFIEAIAFIAGAAVLVLEIAGARMLAPAFGSSIFVWTAQICIVLVALSAGYWYGGKRSEGKGGIASHFAQLGCEVDSFEIDPAVYKAAVEEFGFQPGGSARVHIGDARAEIAGRGYSFDVLFVDAFASKYSIPIHLATREAFEEYAASVNGRGIMVINIISAAEGPRSEMFRSVSSTAREAFPHQLAAYGSEPEEVQNIILVASKEPIAPAVAEALAGSGTVVRSWEGAPALTDEKSAADYAMMKMLE